MNNTNSSMDNKPIIQSAPLVRPTWTHHDHSLFLHAVANGPDYIAGQWQELANAIPGKTADELKAYYEAVERDLLDIEAGRVELPVYLDEDDDGIGKEEIVRVKKEDEWVKNSGTGLLGTVIGNKRGEKVRKKALPWTEDEHRRFLKGLQIYGKGDWRSIARNVVITRTATQVASHAQKYFLRQASLKEDDKKEESSSNKKKRRRCSIHDITTADAVVQVQAQPSSPTPPAASLNGGQGRGVPAVPKASSPTGSQGRGQSSLKIGPSVNGITNIDTTMVVHAQPISSTPPTTSTFYGGGEGRRVPAAVSTSSPPHSCGSQGRGGQAPGNFYGGRGGGRGGPQPLYSFYGGHGGGAPSHPTTLPPTHYYREQGQAPRFEFIKHLAPTHVKGYTLDEEFSFKNSYLSETNL